MIFGFVAWVMQDFGTRSHGLVQPCVFSMVFHFSYLWSGREEKWIPKP